MNDLHQDDAPQSPEAPLMAHIRATAALKVSIASYQNAAPVLHEIVIVNERTDAISEAELTLVCEPPVFRPRTWRIERISAGQEFRLTDLDVALEGGLLARLTEAQIATGQFVLRTEGREIARQIVSFELLARNEWGGIGSTPEMLAAFVQPNDPTVERLLKKAAEVLRLHGKSGALNGYGDGSQHAWEIASALWTAVGGMGLDYALPPASFEYAGLKVRGPSQIADSGLATCLDSTLLFCAALEQCGLHPVIVILRGHSFAGAWLRPEVFGTVVVDDVTALRKRIKLNELVFFETTLVTGRPCPGFAVAVANAAHQLADSEEDAFELAIDIRRARMLRIRPLTSEQPSEAIPDADAPLDAAEPAFEEAPDLDDAVSGGDAPKAPEGPQDRLDRWQRRLLDLSLRNSLLNFRATTMALTFEAPDPGRIEDLLSEGQTLKLVSRPEFMEGSDGRSRALYEARAQEDVQRAHALDALDRNELLVRMPQDQLDGRLIDLYRTTRTAMEEGGANTLFLALGFLSWKRDEKDDKFHRAPLILVPVSLRRKSVRSGFTLSLHADEPRFNPTLIQMLRQDFKLELPVAQGELPKDDHGLDIQGIWRAVAHAVKDIRGWEVVEDVTLASFSFAKYLMWKDLTDRTDQLKRNPVVRHLIDTPRDAYPNNVGFIDPHTLDAAQRPEDTFCLLPADSSQLAAVLAAAKGQDFVLVGPPGTGKSQTIANLIAQCVAERKTVLFVSEKMAALDVVYRRLRDVGLGEFCLELHSNKARKLDVLAQLGRAWKAQGSLDTAEWSAEAQRLRDLRERLNVFVQRLHYRHGNGLTVYTAIGRVVSGGAVPPLGLSWPSADAHDVSAYAGLIELAERLEINAAEVRALMQGPLVLVGRREWSSQWRQRLTEAAREVGAAADEILTAARRFSAGAGLPETALTRNARQGLALLARNLPAAAGRDWRCALAPDAASICAGLRQGLVLLAHDENLRGQLPQPWPSEVMHAATKGLELLARHAEITGQLSVVYRSSVTNLDLTMLKSDWDKAVQSWWPMSWLGRRSVQAALAVAIEGGPQPNVGADLELLIKRRELEREIAALSAFAPRTAELWAGLDTRTDALRHALAFQSALATFLREGRWGDERFDAVAAGTCGSAMAADLQCLTQLAHLRRQITALSALSEKTGGMWNGLATRSDEILRFLDFQGALASAPALMAANAAELAGIVQPLAQLLGPGNALMAPGGAMALAAADYDAAATRWDNAVAAFLTLAEPPSVQRTAAEAAAPALLAEACQAIVAAEHRLRAWCAWRGVAGEADAQGLASLTAALERGAIAQGQTRAVFETAYARWWLNITVDADDVLRTFVSAEHEKRIRDFTALDDRFTELTRAYVRARICAEIPDQSSVGRSPEWGVLNREIQKKRGHLPLRTLLHEIPTALTKLTPCLLMSPLSIAQYLAPGTAQFDVVVFDEASQIPVWEAIGAIARGKQVVMVGDPKQLPPTAFFDRAQAADDDDGAAADDELESILDECLAANLPTTNLSWHYRSRHESLIAFSNHHYYGGGLVTFPSPVTDDQAVSFHFVQDGVYAKGGARTNQREARALVADLTARLKDPAFSAAKLTIGVVTFNAEQQRLIEDLLDEERRKSPELEPFFAEEGLEPVFVKNLESVQGDERDIMYFSITYGPDLTGAVSMNFGPMNRDGGERRLNVAITRARHELRVFSSLLPEKIDLSRTAALGVKDLKHFLEFAQRGPRAFAEAVSRPGGDHESPFESAVAQALARKGWMVHPQIGVSSFRIDLGVVDPDAPGRYLAGVECDGATYHRSATARDRDKLREQVLRGLGWEVLRIWSTDWWHDPAGTLEKTHTRLEALRDRRRAAALREEPQPPTAGPAGSAADEAAAEEQKTPEADDVVAGSDAARSEARVVGNRSPAEVQIAGGAHLPPPSLREEAPKDDGVFREADPLALSVGADPGAFIESSYTPRLLAMIAHVVAQEGPVRDDVLARRIARSHGWARVGVRIRERVEELARSSFPLTQEDVGLFLWPAGSDTTRWRVFRRPGTATSPRPVDEIALPELIALAHEINASGFVGDAAIQAMA
ncbi:MAG: DUF3320 domain-containing protein, partial [Chloroflexi bacterium]|nr:DUF3320 domain-containing protein [Chloroflexota bacterium]